MDSKEAMQNPIETKPEVGQTLTGWAVIRQHPKHGPEIKLQSVKRGAVPYPTLEAATKAAHKANDIAMRRGYVPVAVTLTITDVPAYQYDSKGYEMDLGVSEQDEPEPDSDDEN